MGEAFVAAAGQFSPDFMEEREQPEMQEREEL
jgi:virulence-associated protein VagC